MTLTSAQLLEMAVPLVLGALFSLFAWWVGTPWLVARLERAQNQSILASLLLRGMSKSSYRYSSLLTQLLLGGLWAFLSLWSHPSRAPEALAWLNAQPWLPVEPTPFLLRGLFYYSTFMAANTFVGLFGILFPRERDDAGVQREAR